jgi:hypothetical protein
LITNENLAELFAQVSAVDLPSGLYPTGRESHIAEAHSHVLPVERRLKTRFPLQLQMRYRTVGRTPHVAGDGLAVNMSSGGALVVSEHEIRGGDRVEISIEWPSLLDGRIRLQLVTAGKVVRSTGVSFALSFERYQFRTLSRAAKR